MSTPHEIYNKYQKGDPLTDSDLEIGILHFTALSELLSQSGPVFNLACNEACFVASRLRGYKIARGVAK